MNMQQISLKKISMYKKPKKLDQIMSKYEIDYKLCANYLSKRFYLRKTSKKAWHCNITSKRTPSQSLLKL